MRLQESEVWSFKLSFSTGCTKRNSAAIRSLLKKAFNRGLRLRLTKALPMESMWKENYVTTKPPKRGREPSSFSRNCKSYLSDTFLTALPSEVRDFKSGGSTPLYKPYMYVPPETERFLRCWSKNGYRLCPGVWNRVWFSRELVGVYERIHRFNSKWFRKKEKYANSKWIWRNLFCSCSNLSNDEKNS